MKVALMHADGQTEITNVLLTLIHENVVDRQGFYSGLIVTRDSRVC